MKFSIFLLFWVMSFIRTPVRVFVLLLGLLSTAACGQEIPAGPILINELESLYASKLAQLRTETAGHIAGWPADMECDGALWAGVRKV